MTVPIWTPQQANALDAVGRWLTDPTEQVFRLFGFAGTGKTTLARHLAENVSGLVLFAAYTGKAASVMRRSGCAGATTLHSLLYSPAQASMQKVFQLEEAIRRCADEAERRELKAYLRVEKHKAAKPRFTLNTDSTLRDAALLIIDEVSMVNIPMRQDILSFGKKVLVLGDPAQLPPVQGAGAFTNDKPHILLTDIQRQAKDNAIIRWATVVREGGTLPFKTEGAARKLRKKDVDAVWLANHGGQLLTGKNVTRRALNQQVRKVLGRVSKFPLTGDQLVCLKNDHEAGLLNGVTCSALDDAIVDEDALTLHVMYEDERRGPYDVSRVPFELYDDPEREPDLDPWARLRYQEFDFGYALTVHKSQGSQWDHVTICDDGFGKIGGARQRSQWLYTAITRAAKELVILA